MFRLNTVLLIDDDFVANYLHEALIERTALTNHLVLLENGLEGINFFNKLCKEDECPELIFLDINMPVMDGFEFLKAFNELVYENKQRIKIIVLSSSNRKSDFEKASSLGSHDFLIKPLTTEKIEAVISKHFSPKLQNS